MQYDLLKAGHIVAVIVWFGGMMAIAIVAKSSNAMVTPLQNWDRYVTTPAMVAVWALGLTMAIWAGWFASGWMIAKLAFVLALSAIHGVLSGRLRRLGGNTAQAGIGIRMLLPASFILLGLIVLLVVIKPF